MAEPTTLQQNNVQLVRSIYEAFNKGDIEQVLSQLSPDIHWTQPEGFPIPGVFEGTEEVRRFFQRLPEVVGKVRLDVRELVPAENRVYAHLVVNGTTPNGQDYELVAIHVLHVQNGKITAFQAIGDTAIMDRALRGQR